MKRRRFERRAARAYLRAMAELGVPVHVRGGRCPVRDCPCGVLAVDVSRRAHELLEVAR